MYIDTHCHLEKAFYNNIDNVILDNRNADVLKIIVSGCNKDEILEVVNYALEYEDVYLTLGFHPDCATKVSEEDINWLRKILVENEKGTRSSRRRNRRAKSQRNTTKTQIKQKKGEQK